jgi:HD-GYP domain-containing protein (c-di-GMP phosphodiesterase class II)
MQFQDYGIIFNKNGESIEKVTYKGMDIELLASYDGTEVIMHYLDKGKRWAIGTSEGWNALEFIYVLSGSLVANIENIKFQINKGDYIKMTPIKNTCIFQAIEPTQFIYVCSKPVFQNYSILVEQLKQLGIDVEKKDGYTADHCTRIMNISMLLGEQLHLSQNELYVLNLGSFMHDIGKLKVPDHILQKPGKLSEEEWEIIKKHPIYGHDILMETKLPILMEAAKIVEQHHERYDGSGYPYGLKGEEILISAAIVAVADSLDAMTTDRPYRKALTWEEAVAEIVKGSGTLYNPRVVEAFLAIEKNLRRKDGFS